MNNFFWLSPVFLLIFNANVEARQVTVDGLSFDLGIVSRNIAIYKSCIVSLDDSGEEDMAVFYSQELIKRLHMFKNSVLMIALTQRKQQGFMLWN